MAARPAELRLGFSEGVNVRFTGLTLIGPAGAVPTGAASLAPGDDKVLLVPVSGPLTPGSYKVDWHALATDGHKTDGSYGFTVKPRPRPLYRAGSCRQTASDAEPRALSGPSESSSGADDRRCPHRTPRKP